MSRITCYDGVNCIGGNKILLEDGDAKLWLDFGLNFGEQGLYYEEFLQPKSIMGVYEPVQLGLLPLFPDLYRRDLVSAVADPWAGKEVRDIGSVDGILISHAHVDHIGCLHYIREDIPLHCSAMTLAIMKAFEDTGTGSSDHYCYVEPKECSDTGELKSCRKSPSVTRPFRLIGESLSDGFLDFWGGTPGTKQHNATPVETASSCGGLEIRRYPVDHSLYGASAWAVNTSKGWVVYSGDIRCHGGQAGRTWEFAQKVSELRPVALIIEGTRIDSQSTSTEDQVKQRALEEVKRAKGLVVADFGARNVERLISFLEIAKETGRKLLLLMKDAYLLDAMSLIDPHVPSPSDDAIRVYSEYAGTTYLWQRGIMAKYTVVRPTDIAADQDQFICCFSFFDANELAYIKPAAGSIWVYSSCEAFNEEMRIDSDRLDNWLKLYDVPLLGDPRRDEKNPFHVSGHACQSDLLKLIDIISPEMVIPVHTEHADLYTSLLKGKSEVTLPARGMPIDL